MEPPADAVQPREGYQYRGTRRCKGCGSRIYWWETVAGKQSPHDQDGVSHFSTCPFQEQFRRPRETPLGEQIDGGDES